MFGTVVFASLCGSDMFVKIFVLTLIAWLYLFSTKI